MCITLYYTHKGIQIEKKCYHSKAKGSIRLCFATMSNLLSSLSVYGLCFALGLKLLFREVSLVLEHDDLCARDLSTLRLRSYMTFLFLGLCFFIAQLFSYLFIQSWSPIVVVLCWTSFHSLELNFFTGFGCSVYKL